MPKKLWVCLIVGFLLRIFLARLLTYYPDLYTFQFWSLDLIRFGPGQFYAKAISDYLPGYLYVLGLLGKVFWWFLNHQMLLSVELVYKFPSIVADVCLGAFIFKLARLYLSEKKAFWTALIFLFNPVLIFNSTFWGQVDSFMALFIFASLYFLLKRRYFWSAVLLGVGQVVKPVAVLSLPIFLLFIFWKEKSPREILKYLLIFIGPILVLFIPFIPQGQGLLYIWERYKFTQNLWPFTSLNAFNFWAIFSLDSLGEIKRLSDQTKLGPVSFQFLGYGLFGLANAANFIYVWKKKTSFLRDPLIIIRSLAVVYFTFYLFFTRMHERHLYYGLCFLILLVPIMRPKKILGVSGIFAINLVNILFSFQAAQGIHFLTGGAVALLSVSLLGLSLWVFSSK